MSEDSDFEWDEAKRIATLAKHGIDFVDAVQVFSANPLILRSHVGPEPRWLAVGSLGQVVVTVVFTFRGDVKRIVTARKARKDERKRLKDHARDA